MGLGISIARLLIALAGVAAVFIIMGYVGDFGAWGAGLRWEYAVPIFIVFGSVCLGIGFWMDKRQERKTGYRKPFFDWNND
jgi:hypothetical protein